MPAVATGQVRTAAGDDVPEVAWRPLLTIAATLATVLVALSGRYGYHRDELFFVQAGRHLAWGYPDQPPLTPLLARLMDTAFPGSLVALRAPSAVAALAVVLMTGLLARELLGDRPAQLLAAGCMALSCLLLVVSHLLSTSTFDLLAWTALTLVVVRVLRTGQERWWLLAGAVAGLGLLNKSLVAALLVAVAAGLLVSGPRRALRSPWLWGGVAVALALWSPNLWWQATHGWPQLELSRAIAGGSSGTSADRWVLVPFQLVLIGPALVPVWVAGLVRLLRDPAVRTAQCLAWAYLLLTVVFVVTGGKPYYLGGLYPVLLAAGAPWVVAWLARRRDGTRTIVTCGVLSALSATVLMLPVLPVGRLARTPVVDVNYDAGETVGWPRLVRTLADVHRGLPADERAAAVVLTGNYGEAGAVDRFGPALGLPRAHSGHNAYGLWGPPPERDGPVIAVGLDESRLRALFDQVQPVARVDNGVDLDNDEQGEQVYLCRGRRAPWTQAWPTLVRLG
ncbi:MAG TPA: glycosyltransferase family 39 protein [Actinomycetales bacterium]